MEDCCQAAVNVTKRAVLKAIMASDRYERNKRQEKNNGRED